jgi:hypothetical protein
MSFPGSDFEKLQLNEDARNVVESHGKPEHLMNDAEREIRGNEDVGIKLGGWEFSFIKKLLFDKIEGDKKQIAALKRSLEERTAANPENTKEELGALEKDLDFVRHNLAEKFFPEESSE